jgi:hypothetical protein
LNFTTPISMMASRSSLNPVVSRSMATIDCIIRVLCRAFRQTFHAQSNSLFK